MKKGVLICENWDDKSDKQWLFWLKKRLEKLDFDVSVTKVPEKLASMNEWLPELQDIHGVTSENIHIVRTDPGCITIFNYLKHLARSGSTDPAILVAGKPKKIILKNLEQKELPAQRTKLFGFLPGPTKVARIVKDIVTKKPELEALENLDINLIVMYSGIIPEKIETVERKALEYKNA